MSSKRLPVAKLIQPIIRVRDLPFVFGCITLSQYRGVQSNFKFDILVKQNYWEIIRIRANSCHVLRMPVAHVDLLHF